MLKKRYRSIEVLWGSELANRVLLSLSVQGAVFKLSFT
jgi:hypothetical protein